MNFAGLIFKVTSNYYGDAWFKGTGDLGYHIWNLTNSYNLQKQVQAWAEDNNRKVGDVYNGYDFTVYVENDKFADLMKQMNR